MTRSQRAHDAVSPSAATAGPALSKMPDRRLFEDHNYVVHFIAIELICLKFPTHYGLPCSAPLECQEVHFQFSLKTATQASGSLPFLLRDILRSSRSTSSAERWLCLIRDAVPTFSILNGPEVQTSGGRQFILRPNTFSGKIGHQLGIDSHINLTFGSCGSRPQILVAGLLTPRNEHDSDAQKCDSA